MKTEVIDMLLTMNFKIDELSYSDYITVFATLVPPLIAVCVYGISVYFHFKIIKVAFKEKDMTWKLDITNSLILMVICPNPFPWVPFFSIKYFVKCRSMLLVR